jgi:hypothetical protein
MNSFEIGLPDMILRKCDRHALKLRPFRTFGGYGETDAGCKAIAELAHA